MKLGGENELIKGGKVENSDLRSVFYFSAELPILKHLKLSRIPSSNQYNLPVGLITFSLLTCGTMAILLKASVPAT